MTNSILRAKLFHKRITPSVNQFTYKIFYICFSVDNIKNINSKLLSHNKFNLFSIFNKDYGPRDGSCLNNWIKSIISKNNISNIDKIYLMTHPKIFGFGFNPVSFWFCIDKNDKLIAVLAEVNNTFKEHHFYLVKKDDLSEIKSNEWLSAKKEFHVSPFYNVSGSYQFRFKYSKNNIAAYINYFDNNKTLITSVAAKNIDLNDVNLIKIIFEIPYMFAKVITLIHWQAIKLLLKGNKYISKPKQKQNKLTKSD